METMKIERKSFNAGELTIESRDSISVIRGHAAVFNNIADGVWFREQIAPGAFRETIKTDDVRALWNHDTNYVMGRNRNGTLKLKEDEVGLAVEITPPDTQFARDAVESIRRGDVSQMSFGFVARKETWTEEEDENDLRTIEEVKLWEVSPVTFPFYEDTDVALKSHAEWRTAINRAYNKTRRNAHLRKKYHFLTLGG